MESFKGDEIIIDGQNKYQVVCGAPNVHEGLIGIFAPEGTLIPLYNERLKKATIRGVESCGMMCAIDEIGLLIAILVLEPPVYSQCEVAISCLGRCELDLDVLGNPSD